MSGFKRLVLVFAVLFAVFAAGRATAQDASDIAGAWSGAVATPTGDLKLVLYVEPGECRDIEETFAPEALELISDWISERFVKP